MTCALVEEGSDDDDDNDAIYVGVGCIESRGRGVLPHLSESDSYLAVVCESVSVS